MKHLPLLILCLSTLLSRAQDSANAIIKASDPTQIYTFVEAYAGLNFLSKQEGVQGLDTWQAGFKGTWGIKKFKIGVHLPASNNQSNFEVFDDITLDAGYQIHNNSGVYNATVIGAGFVSPSQGDYNLPSIYFAHLSVYPYSSSLNKYYFNYLGAIKISKKFSFYPGIEWFQRSNTEQTSYFSLIDSTYSLTPAIFSNGFKFSGLFSYDINPKSFLQFYGSWSTESWEGKYGSEELNAFYNEVWEKRFSMFLKYQYAITNYSQLFLVLSYYNYSSSLTDDISDYHQPNLYSLQLGFTYFLH